MPDANALRGNLEQIRERIARAASRAGRKPEEITLVAVSKTFPAEAITAAHALGVRHFGENRVQEWDGKQAALAGLDATWHLIGHLQSNKARRAAQLFDAIDSVDSLGLAQKLSALVAELSAGASGETKPRRQRLPVLIEVHLGGEESKSGVLENELPALVESVVCLPRLELRGLMAIPPFCENPQDARAFFKRLARLHEECRSRLDAGVASAFREVSMGMSHDYEVAIEEGATQVRIGSALFGARTPAKVP